MFSFATASSCLPWREEKCFIRIDLKGKSSQIQGYKKTKPALYVKVITQHVSVLTQRFQYRIEQFHTDRLFFLTINIRLVQK